MSKFHINKHGVPAICKATSGNCPLGGTKDHFDTIEQAQEYVDTQNENQFGLLPATESVASRIRRLELLRSNNTPLYLIITPEELVKAKQKTYDKVTNKIESRLLELIEEENDVNLNEVYNIVEERRFKPPWKAINDYLGRRIRNYDTVEYAIDNNVPVEDVVNHDLNIGYYNPKGDLIIDPRDVTVYTMEKINEDSNKCLEYYKAGISNVETLIRENGPPGGEWFHYSDNPKDAYKEFLHTINMRGFFEHYYEQLSKQK